MVKTIAIQNPLIIQRVAAEMPHAAGRNMTEAAENLILEAVEYRKLSRVSGTQPITSNDARSAGISAAM